MKQRTGSAKIFLDPDPVKCSSKVKRLIFPTLLLFKVRMLQLCSSYVRVRKTGQIRIFPASQLSAKCKTVFLDRVSAVLFYWKPCLKSAVFIWRNQFLDLDSAFGFGFHLRAAAQVALLLVVLTEVVFCLKNCLKFSTLLKQTDFRCAISSKILASGKWQK